MHVEQIRLVNFTSHTDTEVRFPERGVVAVVGANGAGKSALVEAVSYAGWGETLRGTVPWSAPDGQVGAVFRVGELPRVHVLRTRRKGKEALVWNFEGEPPVQFETNTKAQEALTRVLGAWDIWRRASVFSSSDAHNFSSATDAERKRMLEGVLGIDRFDAALKQVKLDAQKATLAVSRADQEYAVALERLTAARTRKADAAALHADEPVVDVAAVKAKIAQLQQLVKDADAEIAQTRAAIRAGDRTQAERDATVRQARATLDRLRAATCPVCMQTIATDVRARAEAAAATAETDANAHALSHTLAVHSLEEELFDLEFERRVLAGNVDGFAAELRAAEEAARRAARVQQQVDEATRAIAEYEARCAATNTALRAAEVEVALLAACERVLGLKGVRAQVTARALGGLEAVVNVWLAKLTGAAMRVKLAAYTETKTAGVSDKIAFEVLGVGQGHGYRAMSAGERRRLDVALVLALGDFVAAAHGLAGGTVFADEVFDALDAEGRDRAIDVLHEMAAERAVFVVTHSDELLGELRAGAVWRVAGGGLSPLAPSARLV